VDNVFVKSAWYVVAWDYEVTRELRPATILGERVVLYRTQAGEPVALEDACMHRKLPLSMGRLKGDEIECGYHGMVYDCSGQCTHVPGARRVPPKARVRSYPTASRFGLVWIWMGDAERANRNSIFAVEHWDDPAWGRNSGGSMTVRSNYLLVTDNLLDPSHVTWVHRTSFGNAEAEGGEVPVETTELATGVLASRWMRNVEVAPFYTPLVRFKGRCDRLQHYEVRYPSHAIIRAVFVPAGAGDTTGADHPDAMIMDSYNFLTPVDENETRYFWFQTRNFLPGDEQLSASMDEGVRAAFAEDRIVLEAVHEGLRNQVTSNLDLAGDRAPLLFRKRLAQMITAERSNQAATP
jgi:phenylpropionate dioxygenase-like ring-hydroxylating dioxygenase large terminal subunit